MSAALSDNMSQGEIDALMQQFAHSGANMAVAGDTRYTMKLQQRGGVVWLAITGVVMQPVPSEFTERLSRLIDAEGAGAVVVDMRQCTYLCSSALGVLALFLKRGQTVGGKLILLGASEKIRRMMELIGIGEHFVHVADEQDAARHVLLLPRNLPRPKP